MTVIASPSSQKVPHYALPTYSSTRRATTSRGPTANSALSSRLGTRSESPSQDLIDLFMFPTAKLNFDDLEDAAKARFGPASATLTAKRMESSATATTARPVLGTLFRRGSENSQVAMPWKQAKIVTQSRLTKENEESNSAVAQSSGPLESQKPALVTEPVTELDTELERQISRLVEEAIGEVGDKENDAGRSELNPNALWAPLETAYVDADQFVPSPLSVTLFNEADTEDQYVSLQDYLHLYNLYQELQKLHME